MTSEIETAEMRSPECTCHPDDRPEGPCRKRFATSECQASFRLEGLYKVRRGIRHHLMTGLIYRSTGKDPKNDGYSFAEVSDWQLRQWVEIIEGAAKALEAPSPESVA